MQPGMIPLARKADARGWLLKVLMRGQLGATGEFGELYLVRVEPGQTRGCHYHERTTEWFCLIEGRATLQLADLDSGERCAVEMDGAEPAVVKVPPRTAHSIRADTAAPACLLAYSSLPYDPAATDTLPFGV